MTSSRRARQYTARRRRGDAAAASRCRGSTTTSAGRGEDQGRPRNARSAASPSSIGTEILVMAARRGRAVRLHGLRPPDGGATASDVDGRGARRPSTRGRLASAIVTTAERRAGGRRADHPTTSAPRAASEPPYVAVFADSLDDVAGQRLPDPPPGPALGRDRARHRHLGRLPGRAGAGGAREAARARGAQGRRGRLLTADQGRLRRRARPARADVQRHAGPARAPGSRAQAVHRVRVARAAHADLLPGRVPGAAGRRGPRRGDAARVPGADPRPGRPDAQPGGRAARPLAAGGGRAGAADRADGRGPARA